MEKLTDQQISDLYDAEYKIWYEKLLPITMGVANEVAKNIFEKHVKKSYEAKLDHDSELARALAKGIAETYAEDYAEDEACNRSYGLEKSLKNRSYPTINFPKIPVDARP